MRRQNGLRHARLSRDEVAAALTAMTVRPLTAVIPRNRPGILFSRGLVATSMRLAGPPLADSRIEPVAPRHGEWVRGPGVTREDAVVLYIHGSGYAICSARTHRGLTTRVSAGTGLPVFACDYRLAPRHRFPSAAEDVRAAYELLGEHGYEPDRILLAADSAGGHLAVDLTLQLLRERRVPPAGLALFSPLYDLSLSLAAARERMRPDPMTSAAVARRLVELYTREADPDSPRLRLSFADVSDFPSTLIQAGGREMLAGDAVELARALRGAGANCELDVVPGQMHVFQALPKVTPQALPALERACAFLAERVPARPALAREAC